MAKRRFGRVRKLPSGRYQARYPGPDGTDRPAPQTFATKTDADVWLTMKEAEIRRDDWIDPDAGAVLVADFGATWIEERAGLRPKTVRLYGYLLRAHIAPHFAAVTVAASPSLGSAAGARLCSIPGSARSLRPRRTGCCARSSTPRSMTG